MSPLPPGKSELGIDGFDTTTTAAAAAASPTSTKENVTEGKPASSVQPDAKPLKFLLAPTYKSPLIERYHTKRDLACAFRIFARYGFDEGVAGHITARDPIIPHHFWVNPFGMHFSMIKSSSLILVDGVTGKVHPDFGQPGNKLLNTAAFMIHGAIHDARPDVSCAAHAHTMYGRTWCAMGRELEMLTQDSCAFYKDHAVFGRFGGLVLGQSEGKLIAEALGHKKVALLQNHGLLTTGATIQEAIFWFISLEKCCQTQLLADAAAAGGGYKPIKIGDEEATFTYKIVGTKNAGWFSAKPLFDKVMKEEGSDFDDEKNPEES